MEEWVLTWDTGPCVLRRTLDATTRGRDLALPLVEVCEFSEKRG